MDDVYDEFLRYLDAPNPALDGPVPESLHTEHGDPDESLLDADDDEEEVQVLTPPLVPELVPLPIAPIDDHQVNDITQMDFETVSTHSSDVTGIIFQDSVSSYQSGTSYCTAYSKYGIREGLKEIPEDQAIDSNKPHMSSTYYQCKEARAATRTYNVTSVDIGECTGDAKPIHMSSVSSLDCVGDTEVLRTFRGTRMSSNNVTVNQNISLSYDPASLICVVCEVPHSILATGEGGAPPIMIFTDQNFLPSLCGNGSCISISRLEDGSLDEIAKLAVEVLDRHTIPAGSLILLGSASHLHVAGTSIFAIDWTKSVSHLLSNLRNVKILPLVPILREDGPGSLGRQLIEIRTWYSKIYEKNTLGLSPVWDKLVEILKKTDEDGLDLGFTEVYSVALPCSLEPGSELEPVKFHTSSSHTTVRSLDYVASNELIRTLVDLLQCKFATVANSEDLLSREPAIQESGGKDLTHCILIGASNLGKIEPHLTKKGITVYDLTSPGWTPTPTNIQNLCDALRSIPWLADSVVIFDVLGNITFRQEQLDGTLAFPHKSGGAYHIEGKVNVCSHSALKVIIKSLKPVFDLIPGLLLFLSTLPRYLYNGCCLEKDHCLGTDTKEYVESLLQDTIALRAVCKNSLLELGLKNFWVPDILGKLLPACSGIPEIAVGLKTLSAADGVHFTPLGYEKLADTIETCSRNLTMKTRSAEISVSASAGPGKKSAKTFYWRGFQSPVGSDRPRQRHDAYMLTHQGGGGKWTANRGGRGGLEGVRGRGGHSRPPYYRRN
jgi:hypothetical protein